MWAWVVCVGGGRRKEGGMEGEGGEEATDSIEPQNSHKQSLFFWLGSRASLPWNANARLWSWVPRHL